MISPPDALVEIDYEEICSQYHCRCSRREADREDTV